MTIKYIRIEDELNKKMLKYPDFNICSDKKDCFITRVQLNGEFKFNIKDGPYVVNADHDDKCLKILEMENENPSDLLLFPEYCISYNIIEWIIKDKNNWPKDKRLWCLPCQGISYNEFLKIIDKYKENEALIFNESYIYDVDQKYFINALLYCFTVYDYNNNKHIVIVPQLKTQAMRDSSYECEAHMTLGKIIYIFGKKGKLGLLSLICADSMNSYILWNNIINEQSNLILLHPQLNSNCFETSFCRIRNEMFSNNSRNVYISCNWSKDTIVRRELDNLNDLIAIINPWSCIYYKFEKSFEIHQWIKLNYNQLISNSKKMLYSGYIQDKKVAIYYSYPYEIIHRFILEKPCYTDYAVLASNVCIAVIEGYIWSDNVWQIIQGNYENEFRRSHYNCMENEYKEIYNNTFLDDKHKYPFLCENKYFSDFFWELISAKRKYDNIKINHNELLNSSSLLFDSNCIDLAKVDWLNYNTIIKQFEKGNLPSNFKYLINNYKFSLIEDKEIYYNLVNKDGTEKLIISICPDETSALKYVNYMKNIVLQVYSTDGDRRWGDKLCVFANQINEPGTYKCYPELNSSIINADEKYISLGKITNGGQ